VPNVIQIAIILYKPAVKADAERNSMSREASNLFWMLSHALPRTTGIKPRDEISLTKIDRGAILVAAAPLITLSLALGWFTSDRRFPNIFFAKLHY
jgi:hypothetical protein